MGLSYSCNLSICSHLLASPHDAWYKAMKEGVKMHDVHIEPKSYKLEFLKKLNVQQIEYISKA